MQREIAIAPMLPNHWPAVRAIYLEGIATGMATFETDAPDWGDWDHGHLACGRMVAMRNGEVIGWAALSPVSRRWVYRGVAEVSIYIAERARGRGVGKALMSALVAQSERDEIWTLQAGILPENTASIALHKHAGFRIAGTRERIAFNNGRWRDTVLMERRSQVAGISPEPV
jgi:phosphinothricin acetyltransferase